LIQGIAPKAFHQTDQSLFNVARLNLDIENWQGGKPTTPDQKGQIFSAWAEVSRPFWSKHAATYKCEFLTKCRKAKNGLRDDVLQMACVLAKQSQLPVIKLFEDDERVGLLAAMCMQLHVLRKGEPFYLPTRKVAALVGFGEDWHAVASYLRIFEHDFRYIALAPGEVRKRGGHRAPRYVYKGRLQLPSYGDKPDKETNEAIQKGTA
jgi:hypothetical protein